MRAPTDVEAVGAARAAHAGGLLADLVAEVPGLPCHAEAVALHARVTDRRHVATAMRPDGYGGRAAREEEDEEQGPGCGGTGHPRSHWGKGSMDSSADAEVKEQSG